MAQFTQKETGGLYELTDEARVLLADSKYFNDDLAPTSFSQRSWTTYHIASLWIGMSICIPSFTMASSLVSLGLSPWLSVLNVALGNLIILIPMQLNSHAGTKYGIPFPVFARLTFGAIGAHIPALSRSLVACGWCAVQAWIGGGAIVTMIGVFAPAFGATSAAPFIGFGLFLVLTLWISLNGSEGIKWMEALGAPILLVLSVALMIWATVIAGDAGYSFGNILQSSTDAGLVASNGGFVYVFLAGLTANIAFWATMALNIPDFSRYAKSQKTQFNGQLIGMPLTMAFTAFVGAFFGQATKLTYGEAIFDPTAVLPLIGNPAVALVVSFGVIIATLTTNIAANVVAPANGFSNISPSKISYKMGVWITVILAIFYRPWWIFGGAGAYIFGWLSTYGGMLAPIAAIFIADYYVVKKRKVDVMGLFQGKDGRYWYSSGWNVKAIIAWFCGFILPLLGNFGVSSLHWVAANGYFVGFGIGFVVYWLLMKKDQVSYVTDEEVLTMTEVK